MNNWEPLLMQTSNVNKERLATLKELFPDLFTLEGTLNPEEIQKLIDPELVKETERFEFKWFGKSHAKRTAFTPTNTTLVYDEHRSVNPEYADGNLIIEGENLEVMKCLLSAYREKIKCIYIDPPYNTGNDFIYSDTWDESKGDYWEHIGVTHNGIKVDTNTETNGRYHSKWLNLMYPRLLLARQLLRHDGVIFISIDDHEVHHLRKLCDEVFGEENFVSNLIWEARSGKGGTINYISDQHEHILLYAKNIETLRLKMIVSHKEGGNYEDKQGKYSREQLRQWGQGDRKEDRPTMYFPIYHNTLAIYPVRADGSPGRWRFSKQRVMEMQNNDDLDFVKNDDGSFAVYRKIREGKESLSATDSILKHVGTSAHGTVELKKLFDGVKIFDTAKPVGLLKYLIELGIPEPNSDIIFDFFAGSGTLAHATIELNREDGGDRRFILVQMPEFIAEKSEAYQAGYKKISDIAIERTKRVIEKIEKEVHAKSPELFDENGHFSKTGFKVYRLAKSNFPRVTFQPDPEKTEEENIALLKKYIQEKEAAFMSLFHAKDIFDEVLLKNGFMLNYTLETITDFTKNTVHKVSDTYKEGLLCLDMNFAEDTISTLETYKEHIFICLERALDTTKKWNLKHLLGDKLIAF